MSFTSDWEDHDNWRIADRVSSHSRFPSENEDIDNMRRWTAAGVHTTNIEHRSATHGVCTTSAHYMPSRVLPSGDMSSPNRSKKKRVSPNHGTNEVSVSKRRKTTTSNTDESGTIVNPAEIQLLRDATTLYCSTLALGNRFTVDEILKVFESSSSPSPSSSSSSSSSSAHPPALLTVGSLVQHNRGACRRWLNQYFGRNDNTEVRGHIVHVNGTSDYICIATFECRICMERMKPADTDHALYPCLHRGICSSCIDVILAQKKCPWCSVQTTASIDLRRLIENKSIGGSIKNNNTDELHSCSSPVSCAAVSSS